MNCNITRKDFHLNIFGISSRKIALVNFDLFSCNGNLFFNIMRIQLIMVGI